MGAPKPARRCAVKLSHPTDASVSADGLAHTKPSGERWYELPSEPGRKFPSITTIISAGNPSKFAAVDRREVALCATSDTTWRGLPEKEAKRYLTQAHARFLADRAMLGSQVHQYLEDRLNGVTPSTPLDPHPEYAGRLASVDNFIAEWEPQVVAVEAAVFNRTHGYAGRGDAILELTGYGLCVVDAKTSADFWSSIDQQLAAVANAEVMVIDGVEHPMPPIRTTFGLLLHADGVYHMGEVPLVPKNSEQFLRAKASMEWHDERTAPPRQQPRQALLPRVEMLERRLNRLVEHVDAKEMVLKRWPADVLTPRLAREQGVVLSPTDLGLIAEIAGKTEREFGTKVSGESLRERLVALPPDLLAIVEVTAQANAIPAINSDSFKTWHMECVRELLEAAELIHAERHMQVAKMVDVAACDAEPAEMVSWVTQRHGATIDRLQELEAETLCQILNAIADGYLSDHPSGLVCQVSDPSEILDRWGKGPALAECRRLAKVHNIPAPRSSAAGLDTPIFVAALAAK